MQVQSACELFPIPWTYECIDYLEGMASFSIVYANSRYWEVEIVRGDRELTASVANHQLS